MKIKIDDVKQFADSLTPQEQKAVNSYVTIAMKPYVEYQAKMQKDVGDRFIKFMSSRK